MDREVLNHVTLCLLLTPNEAESDLASNTDHVIGKNQWLSNERMSDIFHILFYD